MLKEALISDTRRKANELIQFKKIKTGWIRKSQVMKMNY